MKKVCMILLGIVILISFVVHKEPFDVNITIGFEKPELKEKTELKEKPVRKGVPTEYNYPKGVKNTMPNYKPMLSEMNSQMLRASNDDYYGERGDTGIERGS
mgnify:CR=1 FL=1